MLAASMPDARAEVIPDTVNLASLEARARSTRRRSASRPVTQAGSGGRDRGAIPPSSRRQPLKQTNYPTSEAVPARTPVTMVPASPAGMDADANGGANARGDPSGPVPARDGRPHPCDQCGLRTIAVRGRNALYGLDRRQRRGVGAGGKRRRACKDSKTEFHSFLMFDYVSAFDLVISGRRRVPSRRDDVR